MRYQRQLVHPSPSDLMHNGELEGIVRSRRHGSGTHSERLQLTGSCRLCLVAAFGFALLSATLNVEGELGLRGREEQLYTVAVELEAPESLQMTRDIRWADDEKVYIAGPRLGSVSASLGEIQKRYVQETESGNGMNAVRGTAHVAVSEDYLFVASELFAFGWKKRENSSLNRVNPFFETIADLDAQGEHFAVLGLQRGLHNQMAPEGVIAWVGRLGERLAEPEPLMVSLSGPGARTMDNCPTFGVGGVRFLRNGGTVVVPGVERGAYLFSPEGRLEETWDTTRLGLGPDCDFDVPTRDSLSVNPHARWAYLNRFRTVDEILVLGGTPHLVVRWAETEGTRWELIALEPRGKTSRKPLPVESPSRFAHIRGDVRDGRVVLLIFDEMMFLPSGDPEKAKAEPTRIVVLEAAKKSVEVEEPRKVGTR